MTTAAEKLKDTTIFVIRHDRGIALGPVEAASGANGQLRWFRKRIPVRRNAKGNWIPA